MPRAANARGTVSSKQREFERAAELRKLEQVNTSPPLSRLSRAASGS